MGNVTITITRSELEHVLNALDCAREELSVLVDELDWYVTEVDEMCLEAYTILKYAEVEDAPKAE